MSTISSDYTLLPEKRSPDPSRIYRIIYWISLIIVLTLSLLDLAGWAFNLTILKSIGLQWTPMKIITALCLILSALGIVVIKKDFIPSYRKPVIIIISSFLILISLLTILVYIDCIKTGQEPILTSYPFFNFFLTFKMRMALVTSINFFLIGCIFLLLRTGTKKKTELANILIIPVFLTAYFVLISYILGVYSITRLVNVPVALNTAFAFLAISVAVLLIHRDTWFFRLSTSLETGFVMARKLLPPLMILPVVIGWFRIKGEHNKLFQSEEGVILVAITYTICFLVLVWLTSRSLNLTDRKRLDSEKALRRSHEELKQRVQERMLAEKELQNTKNYLENLINYANAPIIVWNTETEIQLFNHAFENLTGYSSSEVMGKKLDLLFPEPSLSESNAKIELSLTENWQTIEIPILTKNKEVKIVLWNSANIYDADNKNVLSTIAQGHDITRRIDAEHALLKSKEKLDLALENGQIGTWEWNIKNDFFECDTRMGKIFGIKNDGVSLKFNDFINYVHEEDVSHFKRSIQLSLNQNTPLDTVFRTRPSNDGFNHISVKALVLSDKDGKPMKMSGVCFDITEMKKGAEKALFNINEDLVRSNLELEQFAYVASHDLQEPLRMVSSFTQLLSQRYKDKLDSDANEFIKFAVDGALRMQTLINDLLEYSRVETRGKNPTSIDMQTILGQAITNLSVRINEKSALITNDDLPVVFADGRQMLQLLQNLIANALKFCNTSPRIHVSAKEENDQFTFSVRDNGIGIESQYFERIFQIFQRLHGREEYGGTGIGLAICRRIVERHGGKIWLESKPGQGTVFFFTIIKIK
jgi:PAS domain S-box-containing protein